jgi:hypothetical protein
MHTGKGRIAFIVLVSSDYIVFVFLLFNHRLATFEFVNEFLQLGM